MSENRDKRKALIVPDGESFNVTADLVKDYAIFTLDREGRITSWNTGAANIKGWQKSEVLGRYYDFLFLEADRKSGKPLKNLHKAERAGSFSVEDWRIKKDGSEFLADITIVQIHDAKTGKHTGYVKIVRDITERQQKDKAQKDSNTRQSEEIDRQKIIEKALVESNAELEAFASAASHDLQEPLRMIISYLQLIERRYKDKFDKDGREFLNFAVDGAERMKLLISDLVVYSRIDQLAKPFKKVDTNKILTGVIQDLTLSADEAAVKITHDKLPVVEGDEVQLRQLFQNLIANGIKFSDKKPATVHVGVETKADAYVFSVEDNGRGIPAKEFNKIFLVFKQLGSRTNRVGTGVGLAIAKKIVIRHQGEIWVKSKEGKGSTFYFTIPRLNKGEHI